MRIVELTFGHCRTDGSRLPSQQIALIERKSLTVFSRCFRGGQVHHPLGAYLTTENCVIVEPSTVIRAYTQGVDVHHQELLTLCREIAITLEQECVLLVIIHLPGTIQWVEPEVTVSVARQPIITSPFTFYSVTL